MSSTKKLTTIAILSAMAMVLNLLIQFPIVPAVSFLSYDPKDIIIVIAGFIYGPMTSFIMSLLCSFLEIVFRGGKLIRCFDECDFYLYIRLCGCLHLQYNILKRSHCRFGIRNCMLHS